MNSCWARLCHVLVDFLEAFFRLIVSPFRLDKLLAITGVSLVGAPSFVDFNGKLIINSSNVSGELVFTNQVDIASYVFGGFLIVAAIYVFRSRDTVEESPSEQASLVGALEKKNEINKSSIQFWFNQIYKINAGINEIEYLMSVNNPSHSIKDYKKCWHLIELKDVFVVKENVDLDKRGIISLTSYSISAILALLSYIYFIHIAVEQNAILAFVVLLITFVLGLFSYLSLEVYSGVHAAKRLVGNT